MKKITSMTIEGKLVEKLEKKSIKEDRSISWIVNEILDNYFKEYKK